MVKYILEQITNDNLKLKCRIFCKDYAIEFSPEILHTYVLDFIKYMNSKRSLKLVDKGGNDIQETIKGFIEKEKS